MEDQRADLEERGLGLEGIKLDSGEGRQGTEEGKLGTEDQILDTAGARLVMEAMTTMEEEIQAIEEI